MTAVLGVPRARALDALVDYLDAAQRADPFAPVTVIVPNARAAIRLPREIVTRRARADGRQGLLNVVFVTLARLAEALGDGRLHAEGRVPLTRARLAAAIRQELTERPGLFGPATSHDATVDEVAERYEELRLVERGSRPEALSRRAADLLALCSSVRLRVAASTFDDRDRFAAAAAALADGEGAGLGGVLVHLPERCRPHEAELLRVLGTLHDLRVHLGVTGGLDASTATIAAALGVGVGGGASIGVLDAAIPAPVVLAAPDPRSEVRGVVRRLLGRLAEGLVPERAALLYATRDPYLRLLVSELGAAGIPFSSASPDPLGAEGPGRLLRALVGLRRGQISRAGLLDLVRSAPLAPNHLAGASVAAWERVTLLLGVVDASVARWRDRLAELAAAEEATEVPRTDPPAAASLAAFLGTLGDLLADGEARQGWAALATWAAGALEVLLGGTSATLEWPEHPLRALGATEALLEELATLEGLEGGIDLERFAERLASALRRPGPPLGRLGKGVVVAPLGEPMAFGLDVAIVLGASAGALPARVGGSPLLGGEERVALGLEDRSASALAARAERTLDQLLLATGETSVVWSRSDGSGRQLAPSPLFDARRAVALPGAFEALGAVRRGEVALGWGELVLARLLDAEPGAAVERAGALGLDRLAAAVAVSRERDGGGFGPYSGEIGELDISEAGAVVSATGLEQLAQCPFRHLLSHVLECEALEAPERRFDLDPRDRGSIVHEVLERFVAQAMVPGADAEAREPDRLVAITDDVLARYARTGRLGKRALFELQRRSLLEDLLAEREADERRRARGAEPVAVEASFGFGEQPPVRVELDGIVLAFRGRIDRIDREADGSVVVVDYKSGRSDPYRAIEKDPVDGGRHLQLPLYARAARDLVGTDAPVRAVFRFIGRVPGEIGVTLDSATSARFEEALEVLSATVAAGSFPPRPGAPRSGGGYEHCQRCDFDGVCSSDRAEVWERATASPTLTSYLQLTGTDG